MQLVPQHIAASAGAHASVEAPAGDNDLVRYSKCSVLQLDRRDPGHASTPESVPIETATPAQADYLVATLVLSLVQDPLMRWMCPDPYQYCNHWASMARTYGSRAFEHGSADYAPGYAGAALWLPPGIYPDEDALVPNFLAHIEKAKQDRLFTVLEQMSRSHPVEPHWHLALIGVDPASWNRGIGSALLKHRLTRCDHDNLIAYVESSNRRNIPFYERHGFHVTNEIRVEDAPVVWPMVREPGHRPTAPA